MSENQELDLYEVGQGPAPARMPDGQLSSRGNAMPADQTPVWPNQKAAEPARESRPEVDENGHRIVLIDQEVFTVVEGDLVLDDDQKELWQEAQAAKRSQFTSRLRAEAVGLGETALSEHGAVTSYLVGIMQ